MLASPELGRVGRKVTNKMPERNIAEMGLTSTYAFGQSPVNLETQHTHGPKTTAKMDFIWETVCDQCKVYLGA
jgi:hypothetical protein